jgi:hypothetical protein
VTLQEPVDSLDMVLAALVGAALGSAGGAVVSAAVVNFKHICHSYTDQRGVQTMSLSSSAVPKHAGLSGLFSTAERAAAG